MEEEKKELFQGEESQSETPIGKHGSGMVTAGFVLGIIGICTSFIPAVNNASFVLGILAVVFGGIGLVKKLGKGKSVTALVLGILSIVITLSLQAAWSAAIDESLEELDYMTGDKTAEILADAADVRFGTFTVEEDEYWSDTSLTVTVTNKSDVKHSFNFTIEAVTAGGVRIETDTVYISDLGAGQSQQVKIFTYVAKEDIPKFKTATFRVASASMY